MPNHYKARCAELEDIVADCLKAFTFIPTDEIRKGYQWFPSEEALRAIERAQDSVASYSHDHWDSR